MMSKNAPKIKPKQKRNGKKIVNICFKTSVKNAESSNDDWNNNIKRKWQMRSVHNDEQTNYNDLRDNFVAPVANVRNK